MCVSKAKEAREVWKVAKMEWRKLVKEESQLDQKVYHSASKHRYCEMEDDEATEAIATKAYEATKANLEEA